MKSKCILIILLSFTFTSFCRYAAVEHENFVINEVGLKLSQNYQEFDASPDGITICNCCGEGCLEVKCPFLLTKMSIVDFARKNATCLIENETGDLSLDRSHEYYYQIQMQMALTNTFHCDFVIWSPTDFYCERVGFNEDFWLSESEKARKFHQNVITPELLGRYFTKETNITWCNCQGKDDGKPMILCDNNSCPILWYHLECLQMTDVPEYWKCSLCV